MEAPTGSAKGGIVGLARSLAIAAMFRYPGGTALDATTHRYSLSRNFLSDLGMTVAYNHQPNRLGATVDGLVVQVVAQKAAVVIVLAAVLFVSREVDHPEAKQRSPR